ncbi:MAG: DUF4214 domain-containing protein [Litorimonas sp.]
MVIETGTSSNELIEGSEFADTLDGAGGNDTLNGFEGNDSIIGGRGTDLIDGGDGNDTIVGGPNLFSEGEELLDSALDTLIGGLGDDTISGWGNSALMLGGAGNDNLQGGPDARSDTLDGGTGADTLIGQGGADVYIVDSVLDFVAEYQYDSYAPGTTDATGDVDEIRSTISWVLRDWNDDGFNIENLTLLGSASINATANEVGNVLTGNSGSNLLSALAGDDTIDGGGGNDTIDGGAGDDFMTGGSGADTFIINALSGDDTITDFDVGIDVLDLSAFSQSQIDAQIISEDLSGNRVVNIGGASVTLLGVSNTPDDDFLPGDTATVFGSIDIAAPEIGSIETGGDRDRFETTLEAGVLYDISLEGVATGGGSLSDPEIIGLYRGDGTLVANSANRDSGVGANALAERVVVSLSGTYQVEVASASDLGTGDYTLTIETNGFVDDFLPGVASGLGTVEVGDRTTGEIETTGDVDGFSVSLTADTTYEVSILGSDSKNGTLIDPDLVGIFSNSNFNGTPITSVQTLNTQFVGDDSVSFFTPQTAGEYFIGVQDEFGGTGTYAVAVDDIGVSDDFAADIDTTGSIVVGGSSVGIVDFAQDDDWFEVTLAANRLYEIELKPNAGANALSDPFFRGVYDSNGVLIQNTENDDVSGSDTSSQLQFVTDVPGTFYLAAGGFGDTLGQYRLELNDRGPLDDNRFDITIEFTSDDTPDEYIEAFEDAVERWEEIITGDLDYAFVEGYGFVDDILIEIAVEDLELTFEGVDQTILAISSVLDQRSDAASGAGALPTYSRIVLNPDEIGSALNLDELVQNTIGRALGFGSLWEEFGLVQAIDGVATYTGSNALREMEELSDDLNGVNVLEDGEDGALAAEYWSEDVFGFELMTSLVAIRRPFFGPAEFGRPDNPISALTIAAMQDLGYQVDYGGADQFQLSSGALSSTAPTTVETLDDGTEVQVRFARSLVTDLSDSDDIPADITTIYTRPNTLSETPVEAALTSANTVLLSASGTSALFFEGVTGDNLLIELTGTFDKSSLESLDDLTGMATSMKVFSAQGQLLFSVDYSRRPVDVADALVNWPTVGDGEDDIIVVDALPGTVVRINPNGGTEDDSRIFTGAGDDYVRGGDGAELIIGGSQDDILLGAGGNDTLGGESGNDTIDGGSGTDTALYSGNQSSYTLTLSTSGTTLTDRSTTGNGTDQISNVEFLNFDTNIFDDGFNLGIFGGPTSLSETQFESFIELYIAYFNRAPDAIGLNFWGTAFANGTSLEATASLFIDQDETRATYPSSLSNADFATEVYANVLDRVADQVGYDFWVGVLDDGSVGRDQFILAILGGAKAAPPDGATPDFISQQLADQAYLSNKTDLGAYYAVHKGMSDVGNASAAMALFDGSQQSLDTAVAAIDGYHQAALSATTGEFLMPLVGVLDDPFV